MNLKKIVVLVVSSFCLSLVSYFLFNRFVLNRGGGSAALAVNSSVASSTVTLDDEILGKTPFYSDTLHEGEPSLVLSNNESTFKTKVKLTGGTLTVVNYLLGPSEDFSEGEIVWLEKSKESSALLLISDPDEANVYLDEELIGQTPVSSKKISTGDHLIKISKEGYRTRVIKIQSQPGFKINIKIRLFLLPIAPGAGRMEYKDEPRFSVFDFSSSNAALYADTSSWAKGIVYYFRNLEKESSVSAEKAYDLFLDYKGQTFDKEGVKTSAPGVGEKPEVSIAYLGRKVDEGFTDDAKVSLTNLSGKILPKEEKVQILPTGTGWLRVRKSPSVTSEEIARVNEGDKLSLLSEEGTFYKVKLPDAKEGYISKSFSRKI